LAVVERQEKRAALVPILLVVAAQGKSTPLELCHSHKNAEQITQWAKRFECPIRQRRDVRRETDAQQVERIDFPPSVVEASQVNGLLAVLQNCLSRSFRAIFGEVLKKRIARSQGEKSQRDALDGFPSGKNAVKNLVRRAVPSNGEKTPVALVVSFVGKL